VKRLNWQAFQVRYEDEHEEGMWRLLLEPEHADGKASTSKIVEVETMADVVRRIVDEDKKELFLKAVGVK